VFPCDIKGEVYKTVINPACQARELLHFAVIHRCDSNMLFWPTITRLRAALSRGQLTIPWPLLLFLLVLCYYKYIFHSFTFLYVSRKDIKFQCWVLNYVALNSIDRKKIYFGTEHLVFCPRNQMVSTWCWFKKKKKWKQ
jgi:hypothetical protein